MWIRWIRIRNTDLNTINQTVLYRMSVHFYFFATLCCSLYIAGLTRWHKIAAAVGRVRQLGLLLNGAGSKPAHKARLFHNKIIIENGVSTIRGPYPSKLSSFKDSCKNIKRHF